MEKNSRRLNKRREEFIIGKRKKIFVIRLKFQVVPAGKTRGRVMFDLHATSICHFVFGIHFSFLRANGNIIQI